eukprot:TRINITY_DN6508_c0_g1_i1.p1 TRINITY_DN6508_c0_g1~~TRINITY_DN6508_c0_g1_i1.p1  ORF type:complete len:394 (-),score=61.39 TRINITY_DN6508_c0_g1_i1:40-1221(-)
MFTTRCYVVPVLVLTKSTTSPSSSVRHPVLPSSSPIKVVPSPTNPENDLLKIRSHSLPPPWSQLYFYPIALDPLEKEVRDLMAENKFTYLKRPFFKRSWYHFLWSVRTSPKGSMNHFLDKTLQTIFSVSTPQQNFFTFLWMTNTSKIEIWYPPNIPERKVRAYYAQLCSSRQKKESLFWFSMSLLCIPPTFLLLFVPLLPSVPFLYTAFRTYVHFSTYVGISRLQKIKKSNREFFHKSWKDFQHFQAPPKSNSFGMKVFNPFVMPMLFPLPDVHFIPSERLRLDLTYEPSNVPAKAQDQIEWYLTQDSKQQLVNKLQEEQIEDYLDNSYTYLDTEKRGINLFRYFIEELKDPFIFALKTQFRSFFGRVSPSTPPTVKEVPSDSSTNPNERYKE